MANPDRLSALDASFLELERDGAHMHAGACMVFEGTAPAYDDVLDLLDARLPRVPRYRQKLAQVPFGQGRPVWADDPHFNARYHLRHTALPDPGGAGQLRTLAGRIFSQELDRSKPLWEMWLVEGLADDRFAIVSKTHHALVDGIAGVDLVSELFDREPDRTARTSRERTWIPRPEPTPAELLTGALAERVTEPVELARALRAAAGNVGRAAASAATATAGMASLLAGVAGGAPPSPLNERIGHHRRFTWVDGDLAQFRAVKDALGGTVNDVVLTAVTGALRTWYRRHGHRTQGVTLKAMLPVSVRAEAERGALGNRVAAVYAPLPLGIEDAVERFQAVRQATAGLKESGQAVGAELLTRLAGFASPTVLSQAARLQSRQRYFNLAITNVPGPQVPLYLCGRRLDAIYPMLPLARNTRLGIAILSYDGGLGFGLVADYDGVRDLEAIADALRSSADELAAAAGVTRSRNGDGGRPRRATSRAHAR